MFTYVSLLGENNTPEVREGILSFQTKKREDAYCSKLLLITQKAKLKSGEDIYVYDEISDMMMIPFHRLIHH
jgi:hypothetical protein